MAKRMLIDATHAEETRVAVVDGNRLEEFDYESAYRKPLKGNILLAKVTRVEPSLQACFVNYGGNRHGFLPFSEIHPDYFRIPVSDREALIEAQREEMEARRAAEEAEDEAEFGQNKSAEKNQDSEDETPPEEVTTIESSRELPDEDSEIAEEKEKPKRRARRPARKTKDAAPVTQDAPKEDAAEATKEADSVETVASAAEEKETSEDTGTEEEKPKRRARRPARKTAASKKDEIVEKTDADKKKRKPRKKAEDKTKEKTGNKPEAKKAAPKVNEDNIGNVVAPEEAAPIPDEVLDQKVNGNVDSGDSDAGEGQQSRRGGSRGRYNNNRNRGRNTRGRGGRQNNNNNSNRKRSPSSSRQVETLGGDGIEGDQVKRPTLKKHYKIQEVIKRGQIMLIQASKEERGNKGAAVTTYLSLPGRYSVLMPNSPRAGGVSRKIANYNERKRMREILSDLSVPDGMSVIMRTAGTSRTKTEIKRDLDYLIRLWNKIRETTLGSTAPELIYEEGSLTKRSIRDIYTRDIEEVLVAGAEGYKETKNFMKMLIPSHAKRVQEYKEEQIPLFTRYQIEGQINEIGTPTVKLKSGGSLVIHPTEALVSIDVNSGRSTKERHIEETALKTNLEAAEEVARQLRLRDLGGLVVIDFIDMENYRNNSKVERKMREALSGDRARIQVGRISNFGLMELSRQRLNPSLAEAQYEPCTHCNGTGTVHTVDAAAIQALRALEEEGTLKRSGRILLSLSNKVAIYILNNKRTLLAEIEARYGFKCIINVDANMPAREYLIEPMKDAPLLETGASSDGVVVPETAEKAETADSTTPAPATEEEAENKRPRGRRNNSRGRGRNRPNNYDKDNRDPSTDDDATTKLQQQQQQSESPQTDAAPSDDNEGENKRPSRRRRRPTKRAEGETTDSTDTSAADVSSPTEDTKEAAPKPRRTRSPVKPKNAESTEAKAPVDAKAKQETPKDEKAPTAQVPAEKKETTDSTAKKEAAASTAPSNDDAASSIAHKDHETVNQAPKKKKRGWWSKGD
jgi:ribonuclease E